MIVAERRARGRRRDLAQADHLLGRATRGVWTAALARAERSVRPARADRRAPARRCALRRKPPEAGHVAAVEASDAARPDGRRVQHPPACVAWAEPSQARSASTRGRPAVAAIAAGAPPAPATTPAPRASMPACAPTPDHLSIIGLFAKGTEHVRRDRPRRRGHRSEPATGESSRPVRGDHRPLVPLSWFRRTASPRSSSRRRDR